MHTAAQDRNTWRKLVSSSLVDDLQSWRWSRQGKLWGNSSIRQAPSDHQSTLNIPLVNQISTTQVMCGWYFYYNTAITAHVNGRVEEMGRPRTCRCNKHSSSLSFSWTHPLLWSPPGQTKPHSINRQFPSLTSSAGSLQFRNFHSCSNVSMFPSTFSSRSKFRRHMWLSATPSLV